MIFPFLLKCWADTERIIVCKDSHQVRGCLVKLLVRWRNSVKWYWKSFWGFLFSSFPCKIRPKRIFKVTFIWKWSKTKHGTVWNIAQETSPTDHAPDLEGLRKMRCQMVLESHGFKCENLGSLSWPWKVRTLLLQGVFSPFTGYNSFPHPKEENPYLLLGLEKSLTCMLPMWGLNGIAPCPCSYFVWSWLLFVCLSVLHVLV